MSDILLNSPHLDWLTMTTFDAGTVDAMSALFNRAEGRPAKRMQYEGTIYSNDLGTIFFGTGRQKNRDHHLIQVSGLRADNAWGVYHPLIRHRLVKVTRLDLAVTVALGPRVWSQAGLFSRMRRFSSVRAVSYMESKSGPQGRKLATVYIGDRSSDRMTRIYEKVMQNDEIALRFEVEYKAGRAADCAEKLCIGTPKQDFLLGELGAHDDPPLSALFYNVLKGEGTRPKVAKGKSNTERWLLDTVFPALRRFMSDHEGDKEAVRYAFLKVLLDADIDETDAGPVQ